MDNLRQLLIAVAALTLIFSVVSGANPNYFVGHIAFADDDGEDDEDNSGSSNHEDDDDSNRQDKDDETDDEHTVTATFGDNSKVELGIDNEIDDDQPNTSVVEADLQIETEDQDLADGDHEVSLTCETPDFEKAFDSALTVEDGEGKLEEEFALVNGTAYQGCVVAIGDVDVALPDFRVIATSDRGDDEEDDEEDDESARDDDEEDDEEDDDKKGRSRESKAELETEDGKVDIEVEVDTNMTDGTYDAKFTCEEPDVDMTIEDGFKVQDGEGKLEAELVLAQGSYSGCELESGNRVIAEFESFAVRQGQDDDDDDEEDDDSDVEQKRKEKRKEIVSKIRAIDEHRKRVNANPASPGDYQPGLNYTLTAEGTATTRGDLDADIDALLEGNTTAEAVMSEADVEVDMDMGVWKSNKALVLLSILNGTIQVDNEEYTVELGFAMYSLNHDAMRLGALVSDEDGNIYKLKLRGTAEEGTGFPTESGDSIDLVFEGNSGPARNSLDKWHLELEGTIEAE